MKNVILMALLCMGFFSAQAQNEFTIQGKVKGLKDGTVVTLFRTEGNVGSSIANDTVKNESFFFKEKAEDQEIGKYSISCYGAEGFPPMGLDIWAAPGAKINISGNNTYIYTWKVKSPVEQQKVRSGFVDSSRELWNEFQKTVLEYYKFEDRRSYYRTLESNSGIRGLVGGVETACSGECIYERLSI